MKSLIALALLLIVQSNAQPLTLTLSGAEITCDYDEPTTNEDGSPLTDLLKTTLYYNRGASKPVTKAKDVPATALTGGGHITTTIIVPVLRGEDVVINVYATATDTATIANESVASSTATIRIDRLPPSAPK